MMNGSRKTQNRPRSLKNPGGFNARSTRSRRKSAREAPPRIGEKPRPALERQGAWPK
jgi:hypothetical protein